MRWRKTVLRSRGGASCRLPRWGVVLAAACVSALLGCGGARVNRPSTAEGDDGALSEDANPQSPAQNVASPFDPDRIRDAQVGNEWDASDGDATANKPR